MAPSVVPLKPRQFHQKLNSSVKITIAARGETQSHRTRERFRNSRCRLVAMSAIANPITTATSAVMYSNVLIDAPPPIASIVSRYANVRNGWKADTPGEALSSHGCAEDRKGFLGSANGADYR